LTYDETALVTTLILNTGLPAPREVVDAVYKRTDGIPLHVEELLGALGDEARSDGRAIRNAEVPDTIEDAILARLARLSDEAQAVALAGAVMGRCFSPEVLAGVMDRPIEDLDAPLDELVASSFLYPFQSVDEGQDFEVVVDYAHKPDAIEAALATLRPLTAGSLIVVLGAGGDRDPGKRPLMGRAARELADRVLVTSDNPRNEEPEAIIDQVMEGAGPDAERDADRRRAIGRAIVDAEPGDVVVIAGKGHEQGQEFERGRKEPFDDKTVAREALRSRVAT